MATTSAVNAGSTFCRDCGGSITERGGLAWCENTTEHGNAIDPKDHCETLGRRRRLFCEQCQCRLANEGVCPNGHVGSNP